MLNMGKLMGCFVLLQNQFLMTQAYHCPHHALQMSSTKNMFHPDAHNLLRLRITRALGTGSPVASPSLSHHACSSLSEAEKQFGLGTGSPVRSPAWATLPCPSGDRLLRLRMHLTGFLHLPWQAHHNRQGSAPWHSTLSR